MPFETLSTYLMLAFVHVHKTGGTTVGWTLRSAFGARHCEIVPTGSAPSSQPWETPATAADLTLAKKIYPNLRSIGGHHVQPHSDLHEAEPGLKYFTMVRDPLSMRASMYQHGVAALGPSNISLESWLAETQSQNRLTKMLAGRPDSATAIRTIQEREVFVGRTDSFDTSMVMFKRLYAPDMDIRYRRLRVSLNSSVARDLLADKRTRAMLKEGIEADLELYDWITHELFPKLKRLYGPSLDADTDKFKLAIRPFENHAISQDIFQVNPLSKMALLRDIAPFSRGNIVKFLGMKSGIYLPSLRARRLCNSQSENRREP